MLTGGIPQRASSVCFCLTLSLLSLSLSGFVRDASHAAFPEERERERKRERTALGANQIKRAGEIEKNWKRKRSGRMSVRESGKEMGNEQSE